MFLLKFWDLASFFFMFLKGSAEMCFTYIGLAPAIFVVYAGDSLALLKHFITILSVARPFLNK